MNMTKKIMLLIMAALLSIQLASAATVHGSVYDDRLRPLQDVKMEIDTVPKQTYVSKEGTYTFTLPLGEYTLKAEYIENGMTKLSAEETIPITEEGDFVVDIILFEPLDSEELLEDSLIDIEDINLDEDGSNYALYLVIATIAILISGIFLFKRSKPKKKEDDGTEKLLKIIRDEGGRTTQKELRKRFPLSEAKISLMITELEHKGKIKKIKKGRGNIIILNR